MTRDELRELIRSHEEATPDYRGDGAGGEYYDPYTDFEELTDAVWAWVQERYGAM